MSWGSCSCVPLGQLLLPSYLTAISFLISYFVSFSGFFCSQSGLTHIAHAPLLFRSLHHIVIVHIATLLDFEWEQHAAAAKSLQHKVPSWIFVCSYYFLEHLPDWVFFPLASPLPTRIYCITDIDPDHRKLSQLEAVIRFLTGEEPDLECESQAPNGPWWDFPVLTMGERGLWQIDWCQTKLLWHLLTQAGLNSSLA